MSTIALQIIELVKCLPVQDQQAMSRALAARTALPAPAIRRALPRLPDGIYFNPDGIPNDDPIFEILERIEAERQQTPGADAPDFD